MFYVRADLSSGTYSIERDFQIAGQVDFTVVVDVEELSSTSYQSDFYTRETESDSWQLMGGIGSDAVDTSAIFNFTRSRYVKIDVTTTGSDFESGVVGY